MRVPGEVPVEPVGVPALVPVVELLADGTGELVDDLVRVDEVERTDPLLREARRLVHQREVGLDLPRRVGTLHLDDDALPVRQRGAMHLTDRGRLCGPRVGHAGPRARRPGVRGSAGPVTLVGARWRCRRPAWSARRAPAGGWASPGRAGRGTRSPLRVCR